MNASVVSVNTAAANVSTDWATIRFTTLGRMWRRMIRPLPDPMTRARSTNIRSLSDSTWLRITRAVVAQLVRPITMTITSRVERMPNSCALPPMTSSMIGARISASTIVGRTRKKSDTRMRKPSTAPPTNPATIPTRVPITIVTSVARSPIVIEIRAPWTVRLSMSRPSSSVPNRYCDDGGSKGAPVAEVSVSRGPTNRVGCDREHAEHREDRDADEAIGPAEQLAQEVTGAQTRSRQTAGRGIGTRPGDAGDAHARTLGSR